LHGIEHEMLHSAPEDYGLSEAETLEHRVRGIRPVPFDAFWAEFREEIDALSTHWRGAIDAPVNDVVIQSARAVRIMARLTLPPTTPRGVVVTSHGSSVPANFPDEPEPWTAAGLATIRVRVRGYPPSTLDIDDLRAGWITHHIGSPTTWIVRGAIADVVQAVRCARRFFGSDCPIALHGESLGGGLAVMAAAELTRLGLPPQRMVLAHPSLGDWKWRAGRYCNGMGGEVEEYLATLRADGLALIEQLRLFDAALHATDVTCPTLTKLATRDDVVPAPSAAAVHNAIGSSEKRRFATRYGHFEGGLADARRHAAFDTAQIRFLDPQNSPVAALSGVETELLV
jgi:cephalosporin-C deacetylase-like acetyl esterase